MENRQGEGKNSVGKQKNKMVLKMEKKIKIKFPSLLTTVIMEVNLCLEKREFIIPNTLHVQMESWLIQEL